MKQKELIEIQKTSIEVLNRQVGYLEDLLKQSKETNNNLCWGLERMGEKYCTLLDLITQQYGFKCAKALDGLVNNAIKQKLISERIEESRELFEKCLNLKVDIQSGEDGL